MRFLLVLYVTFSLFACESEPTFDDTSGEPSVFFQGTIDGDYLNLEAGVDDVYNYTFIQTNEFDFFNLHSRLSYLDSTGPALEVVLLDPVEIGDDISVEQRFKSGPRSFLRQSDAMGSYDIKLISNQLTDYLYDYEWITDQGVFHSASPEISFNELGSELICLKGQTLYGDTIHTCKRINLDQNKAYSPALQLKAESPDSFFVEAVMEDIHCDRWEWNGYEQGNYRFSVSKDDWSNALVHLKMYNGGVMLSDIVFAGELGENDEPMIGHAGFDYELLGSEIKDRLQHGKVMINFDHPQNGWYSSKYADNMDQMFEIQEVESFGRNENGEKTVLLTLSFRANLKTEMGHQMTVTSDSVKMAFPIPES